MRNLRKFGRAPFSAAVIHGGPGAPGEMAPVARQISSVCGVLEPLQTSKTIEGQIDELKAILKTNGDLPVTLIGWSWGAWLSYLLTAHHPKMVEKLILVGSGPFEEKYASNIMKIRLNRLSKEEQTEVLSLTKILDDPSVIHKDSVLARFGKLISKADSYDPVSHKIEILECQHDIYQNIWEQASKLRKNKKLLGLGKTIHCPVLAIHGDYDPHPYEGVRQPLSRILKDFRFILLKQCGHKPWIERSVKDIFFKILRSELE
jgi:pimeloyl-ACP methyl ester carboxylesterase